MESYLTKFYKVLALSQLCEGIIVIRKFQHISDYVTTLSYKWKIKEKSQFITNLSEIMVGKVATQCVAAAGRSQEARFIFAYYKGNRP